MSEPEHQPEASRKSLSEAIRTGHTDTVRARLRGGEMPSGDDVDEAESGEFPEICKVLIEAGYMDINHDLGGGGDLLVNAVWELEDDFVRWLLEHGANPNSGHLLGDSSNAICAASQQGRIDLAQLLIDHDARVPGSGALPAAAEQGNVDMVLFLIRHGAEIDEIGVHDYGDRRMKKYEGTALHKAAARGDVDLAKLLLEKGAGLKVEDPMGRTPLLRAKEEGYEAMVNFLRSKE